MKTNKAEWYTVYNGKIIGSYYSKEDAKLNIEKGYPKNIRTKFLIVHKSNISIGMTSPIIA